jgi:hypothetical protein
VDAFGVAAMLVSLQAGLSAGAVVLVPEIDSGSALTALGLLSSGLMARRAR